MATFYPNKPGSFNGSQGEKLVYEALQTLDSRFVVFHSFHWISNGNRSEGEADFVVFHPDYGILVIEVKDGKISYEQGNWYSTNRKTHDKELIKPISQANNGRYMIITELEKHMGNVPSVFCAVWFTDFDKSQYNNYPKDAPAEIILDTVALEWPEMALRNVFEYWFKSLNRLPRPLNEDVMIYCINLLQPTLCVAETFNISLEEMERESIRLTNQQYAVLHYLQEQNIAAIHGAAGTGKTVLAVEKGRMIANDKEEVLLLCFNEFLLERLVQMKLPSYIKIHNERTLAQELMPDKDIPFEMIIDSFENYFAESFDDDTWKYKNVIIDEAQDFPSDVLSHIYRLVQARNGIFYVFYDRSQSVITRRLPDGTLKENASNWIDRSMDCRLVLYQNCRNTAEISESLKCIGKIETKGYVNENHGNKPIIQFFDKEKKKNLIEAIESFVNTSIGEGISLADIVILTVNTLKYSVLTDVKSISKIPISNKQEIGKVWFTTVRRFKGLEAKAVLVLDVKTSEMTKELTRRLLYVGCSRATSKLKVLIVDDVSQKKYVETFSPIGVKIERRKDLADWLGLQIEK